MQIYQLQEKKLQLKDEITNLREALKKTCDKLSAFTQRYKGNQDEQNDPLDRRSKINKLTGEKCLK